MSAMSDLDLMIKEYDKARQRLTQTSIAGRRWSASDVNIGLFVGAADAIVDTLRDAVGAEPVDYSSLDYSSLDRSFDNHAGMGTP